MNVNILDGIFISKLVSKSIHYSGWQNGKFVPPTDKVIIFLQQCKTV